MARFFAPATAWQTDLVLLDIDESRHLGKVLRMGQGDKCVVFDGRGQSAECVVQGWLGKQVQLQILQSFHKQPPKTELVLLQSIPKGSNMDWIVQKSVELGVSKIIPLITRYTVARPSSSELGAKQAKWQKVALEACKQCGADFMPEVAMPLELAALDEQALQALTQSCPERATHAFVAALLPQSKPLYAELAALPPSESGSTRLIFAVGPEGDFSPAEYEKLLQCSFKPVSLGDLVLRVETATFMCLAVPRCMQQA